MNKRILGLMGALFCVSVSLAAVSGCAKKDAESAPVHGQPTPPANLPPAVAARRAAEEMGRAEDARRAASSAGAKFRK